MRASILVLLGLLSAPALAQGMNRATYLGPDREEFRRDFEQGVDYFLDRFSYVVEPPWRALPLKTFRTGARWAGGSTTASEFTLEGYLGVEVDLGEGFVFRTVVLQSENQDARYLRHALELGYEFSEGIQLLLNVEWHPEKEENDVTLGLQWEPSERGGLRVLFTAVDVADERGPLIRYDSIPVALAWEGWIGDPDGHQLRFDLGIQLPLEADVLETQQRLDLERSIGRLEGRLRAGPRDRVVVAAVFEWTDKQLRGPPADQQADRNTQEAWVEWWHRFEGDRQLSGGFVVFHKSEDGDQAERRTEWYLVLRGAVPFLRHFTFEPLLLLGHARVASWDFDGVNGRFAIQITYLVGTRATLSLNVASQLGRSAFGGGGFFFQVDF